MEKKEAMKILKDFHDKSALFSVRTALDTIIPELNESEDEEIKKWIIDDIIYNMNNEPLNNSEYKKKAEKAIAWLEKQGEERTVNYPIEGMFPYTDPADTLDGEIENIWNKLRNCDNTFTAAKSGFYEVIHHFATWLEKQGDMSKMCPTSVQDEQQPIDKVEPKFKVGDWITNGDYTWKIVEVKPLDYILQSQDGNIVDDTISHVDEQFHSFTIKDAKDGDVLCTYECCEPKIVFILKGTPKKHYALSYHCYYNIMYPHFGTDSEKGCLAPKDEDVKPATKEQRDALFAKIKEERYEWSEDTHELKKISQRMVSAEAKEALYDKPTDEEMKELLRTEYEKGRADTIAEMEKDWSEEDDVMINKLLAVVKLYYDRSGDDLDKQSCISFLKSLKDKVQPQPKQEWSEEDEIARKALINLVEIYYGGCIDKTEKKRLLNLLKSLRPQNTWKPSEEQMSTLNLIISDYYHACTKECDKKAIVLKSILEQLKQL